GSGVAIPVGSLLWASMPTRSIVLTIHLQRLHAGLHIAASRHIGAVAVSRIDEVDADLGNSAQRRQGGVTVRRLTPDARTGETHRPVPESVDDAVSDREVAGGAGVDRRDRCVGIYMLYY